MALDVLFAHLNQIKSIIWSQETMFAIENKTRSLHKIMKDLCEGM